jgi:folate-binding protein YgfZ
MDRIDTQYRIIEAGAGWTDRSARGRLKFEGRDARAFLQALVTNDLDAIELGQGVDAAYLTPQGRMIAMLRIFRRDADLLVEVAPGQAAGLTTRFDQLIFAEQVNVIDVSGATAQLAVIGGNAADVVARAFGGDAGALASRRALAHVSSGDALIARTDDSGLPAFDVFVPAAARESSVKSLEAAGAVAVDDALVDALRIDAARPAFGVDMTEDTIPLEAGLLERAISTTKGCYVGQEVIVRVLHRGGGRVARRLVQLAFGRDAAVVPPAGTSLFAGGQETGRVTSAAISPRTRRVVALGYVHRDVATIGASVAVHTSDGEHMAEITRFAG